MEPVLSIDLWNGLTLKSGILWNFQHFDLGTYKIVNYKFSHKADKVPLDT